MDPKKSSDLEECFSLHDCALTLTIYIQFDKTSRTQHQTILLLVSSPIGIFDEAPECDPFSFQRKDSSTTRKYLWSSYKTLAID
jgi:hypothetical protein